MSELWKDIPGYEGKYQASTEGRVRSLNRVVGTRGKRGFRTRSGVVLKQSTDRYGYRILAINDIAGRRRTQKVHRLVLLTFVGPCPAGMQACHNDGNPTNNRIENLRWDTIESNAQDRVRHGTHWEAALTHCKRGHEFNEVNTYVDKRGIRNCRRCARLREQAKRAEATRVRLALQAGLPDTCKRGHAFDEENTYYRAGSPGWRACRQCKRERKRELRALGGVA